jgi:hypothetical protein
VCHVGEFHVRSIDAVLGFGSRGPADGVHAVSGIPASLINRGASCPDGRDIIRSRTGTCSEFFL